MMISDEKRIELLADDYGQALRKIREALNTTKQNSVLTRLLTAILESVSK